MIALMLYLMVSAALMLAALTVFDDWRHMLAGHLVAVIWPVIVAGVIVGVIIDQMIVAALWLIAAMRRAL